MRQADEWEDESDDAAWDGDEGDSWADEDDATLPCPACGAAMFEDADRCPTCGDYVTAGGPASARPAWVIITAIACLAAVVWWIVGGRP